jgi:hypothetical protein
MNVQIFTPRLNVQCFSWSGTDYSAEMHGDIIGVSTQKQIDSPAGHWAIVLTSRRDEFGRTWAKRIAPADYVEIYGSRTALPNAPQQIIMRGFVDNVDEDIMIGQNGQVQRVVMINGSDFGKVLLTRKFVYATELNPLALTDAMKPTVLANRLQLDAANFAMSPKEFLGRIKEIVLNDPTIGATQPSGRVPKLQAFTDIPAEHQVQFINLTPQTGAIWNVMEAFQGKPFNELFVRDDDNFPCLYWRLAPLHNKVGKVANGSTVDEIVSIGLKDVISERVGRSDRETFCSFMTLPTFLDQGPFVGAFKAAYITTTGASVVEEMLDPLGVRSGTTVSSVGPNNPILRKDIFNRYGYNIKEVAYPLFPIPPNYTDQKGFGAQMSYWLHNVYSWNPVQEAGVLVVQGNPGLRIGQHIMITEQQREFYIEDVSHSFSIWPTPEFKTTLRVTRGLWLASNPYPEAVWL